MYPEQVSACSGFLLLFFSRLIFLAEQLACAFRRLAGDVFHRHALSDVTEFSCTHLLLLSFFRIGSVL